MELTPEELLFAALVRLAIKDARQAKNERLRADALQWLWTVAPSVAEVADLSRCIVPDNAGHAPITTKVAYTGLKKR